MKIQPTNEAHARQIDIALKAFLKAQETYQQAQAQANGLKKEYDLMREDLLDVLNLSNDKILKRKKDFKLTFKNVNFIFKIIAEKTDCIRKKHFRLKVKSEA
jgi:hypothetical protein